MFKYLICATHWFAFFLYNLILAVHRLRPLVSLCIISISNKFTRLTKIRLGKIFGTLTEEREVEVPAKQAWEVYGSIQISKLILECLPQVFDKIDVVEGNGGLGTILEIFFVAGATGFTSYKEKFTKVDHGNFVKEAEVTEGAYMDIGFTLFRIRVEIILKTETSCIIRCTIEYNVKKEAVANASVVSIQPTITIMESAATYLLNYKKD